jgi:outer membrane protein assembly factor BamE
MSTMRKTWILSPLLALTVGACGIVYHVPVYQGNLLQASNVQQVKVGMSKQEVVALLGTPSIADPFHSQRWDYTASEQDGRTQYTPEIKTLTLVFNGNSVASISGNYFPDQNEDLSKKMGRFGNLPKDKKAKNGNNGNNNTSSSKDDDDDG